MENRMATLDLTRGVRVEIRPFTTAAMAAAQAGSVRRLGALRAMAADLDPDMGRGLAFAFLVKALARYAVFAGQSLPLSPKAVERMMDMDDLAAAVAGNLSALNAAEVCRVAGAFQTVQEAASIPRMNRGRAEQPQPGSLASARGARKPSFQLDKEHQPEWSALATEGVWRALPPAGDGPVTCDNSAHDTGHRSPLAAR